ncbi:hypothetical protein, partial [Listeria monocytogenes]|uniref:hypothetical protein n=1 Tax=Listeria monocytogenes TaxID=1639 RepID=UPI002FDC0B3A
IGCGFFHSRYEDLNTFQGDFPLILCLPLRYDITNTGGNIYAGGFDTSLVFFIKSDDNLDRTQQTDLARIYLCDALVSKFVLKLQQIQG